MTTASLPRWPVHPQDLPGDGARTLDRVVDSFGQCLYLVIHGTNDDPCMLATGGLMQPQKMQPVEGDHRPPFTLGEIEDGLVWDALVGAPCRQ